VATAGLASLTVVIPAHNEEGTIRLAVSEALAIYPSHSELVRVIVVDDASTDMTATVVEEMAIVEPRLQLLALPVNVGANRAIYAGVASAGTELVGFLPADRQVRASELRRCLDIVHDADIVWTTRVVRADPWFRRVSSASYNWLVRVLFGLPIHDVDSVFVGRREPIQQLLPLLVSRSDFLPVELVARALRRHLRLREVAIVHYPRMSGQASAVAPRFVVKTFVDLVRGAWVLRRP
jgi:glycosyltransferase involved in cell wall biosynthesis